MAAQEFTFDVEADKALKRQSQGEQVQTSEIGTDPAGPMSISTDDPAVREARQREREQPTPDLSPDDLVRIREENDYLKRKLGEQGSQMGELKAAAGQASRLQAQMDALQRQQASGNQADINNLDLFGDIPDDQKYMSPAERGRLNHVLKTLAFATEAQLRKVKEEAVYSSTRMSTGITDEEEAAVVAQAPWVERLSGMDRLSAVRTLVEGQRKERGAPTRAANEASRSAARREYYVESSSPTGGEPTDALEAAHDKTLREIRSGKYKTAAEMEQALRKVGIGRVDDTGRRLR